MTTQTNTMAEAFANIKAATTTSSLQERNIKRVQDLVAEFQAGRPEGYMAGVADDIKGSVLGGLIPGLVVVVVRGAAEGDAADGRGVAVRLDGHDERRAAA